MKSLRLEYIRKKDAIKDRLKEFQDLYKSNDEDIFAELCFCILTPQSKAVTCDKAVKELMESGLLLKGSESLIKKRLVGVRFPNNKARYLKLARNIKLRLDPGDPFKTREWLVKNIKGLGYKEASHFLRNIGLGKNLAILDVHILKNMLKYKIIGKLPAHLSKNKYLFLENKLRKFSKKIKIPMNHLDLLFWSNETGLVFK